MNEVYGMDYSAWIDKGNGSKAPVIRDWEHQNPSDNRMWTGNGYPTDPTQNIERAEGLNGQESILMLPSKVAELQGQQVHMMRDIVYLQKELHKRFPGKVVSETLAETPNGKFLVLKTCEFGDQKPMQFFLNAYGPVKMFNIVFFDHEDEDEILCVQFSDAELRVIFKPGRIKENEIYRLFLRAGLKMNDGVKRPGKLLYEYFACKKVESVLKLPYYTGWLNGKFYDASSVEAFKEAYPKGAPILQKRLSKCKVEREALLLYLTQIRAVSDWRNRLMLLLFPYYGMIRSIIPEKMAVRYHALNVITTKPVPGRQLAGLLQIYNRERTEIISLDTTPKKILAAVKNCKDDVVLLQAGAFTNDQYHGRTKPLRLIASMMQLVSEEGMACPVALAFITKNWIRERGVYNMILSEDDHLPSGSDMARNRQGMDGVMNRYLSLVQMELSAGEHNFKKAVNIYGWIFGILTPIFNEAGIDLSMELDLPDEIDFKDCFVEEDMNSTELVDLFVTATRKFASKWVFVDKKAKEVPGDAICYDQYDLWIPPGVLTMILDESGLDAYKRKLLQTLREEESLICEGGGLTSRLQVNKVRTEYYRIHRSLFEKPGCLDIVDLGEGG